MVPHDAGRDNWDLLAGTWKDLDTRWEGRNKQIFDFNFWSPFGGEVRRHLSALRELQAAAERALAQLEA